MSQYLVLILPSETHLYLIIDDLFQYMIHNYFWIR